MNHAAEENPRSPMPSFLGTLTLVFIAIAALFIVDTIMANAEHAEDQADAEREFTDGQRLEMQGRNQNAIEKYRAALTVSRERPEYQLALARALLASGKPLDAETIVDEVLTRDSTDGGTNLLMARIQAKEKNIAKATAYYHRAIFGHWESDVARHQGEARTELVELLAREGLKKDLLAELIPLQDEVSGNPSAEMRIARLYLFAGSPARAVDLYHQVLSEAPDRADAQAGLGEAEFARGNYRTARADFRAALRLKQDDNVIRKKLDRTNEVLALQPIRRDLNSRERYRRSLEVLNLALASLIQCTGATRAASIAEQINQVQAALSRSVRPAEESDAAESNVDLAERTWDLRKLQCGTAVTENDQILELALAKVGQ